MTTSGGPAVRDRRRAASDPRPALVAQLRAGGWRLRPAARKVTLVVHIAAAGSWLGLDLAVGVLVVTAMTTSDSVTASVSLAALAVVAPWPLAATGLLSLLTGLLLGVGSKYGLLRYWWVLTKLLLNLILLTLTVVLLGPGVQEMSTDARAALADGGPAPSVGTLIFPPVVSSSALLLATVLSVAKPWGRRR